MDELEIKSSETFDEEDGMIREEDFNDSFRLYDLIEIKGSIPADGWYAVYKNNDLEDENEEKESYYPLVAWLIVKIRFKDNGQETEKIVGVDAAEGNIVDICEDDADFIKYVRVESNQ